MSLLIKGATLINEGRSYIASVLVVRDKIAGIYPDGAVLPPADETLEASELWLFPGVIDDQVHFREPGALHKACIASESAAAVAGGVTSFMDMPNNQPPCCSLDLWENKMAKAAASSYANYAFYIGADNHNIEEIKKADPAKIPGVKVFMGSSTGNMLVDDPQTLARIFAESPVLIATHCEEETLIQANLEALRESYRNREDEIPVSAHPQIRSREACLKSTQKAVELALRYGSRLHVLHLTTKEEVAFLTEVHKEHFKEMPLPLITAEVCVHHLFFCDTDYARYGNLIKCNPAIKSAEDRAALRRAVKEGIIRVVATDHAPHTWDEKQLPYIKAPSGLPLIQYSLPLMLQMARDGIFTFEEVVEGMCHAPARNFGVEGRGFIREGYQADLVLIDPQTPTPTNEKPMYACGWSPLAQTTLSLSVYKTFINGYCAYSQEQGLAQQRFAQALTFSQ
jgi:Dihydroorotase and related cyclic amidohydrolases